MIKYFIVIFSCYFFFFTESSAYEKAPENLSLPQEITEKTHQKDETDETPDI